MPKLEGNVSYDYFFENFLLCNRPCIIKNVSNDWEASKNWVKNNSLNVDYFNETYGNATVPVADCGKKVYNVQEKQMMKLNVYLHKWEEDVNNETRGNLYLKDWHFTKEFRFDRVYRVPSYFASDWLNEYFSRNADLDDDYRFVYIGPTGSWTPFHADVFTSYSWSVNICGEKKWLIFPPGEENKFRDNLGNLQYDLECHLGELEKYVIYQKQGEAIFVPSGWHHQVWNVKDTVSINHNWINGCNISYMWESLYNNLQKVKKEIEDCRDMENWMEQCQIVLQASYGFDYFKFYFFLRDVARPRVHALRKSESFKVYGDWEIGRNHMLFDLKRISNALKLLTRDEDFMSLEDGEVLKNLDEKPVDFLRSLEDFLFEME